jgi:uncharacterized protein YjiK
MSATLGGTVAILLIAGAGWWAAPPPDPWGLGSFDLSKDGAEQHDLPGRLREISGLATTSDGRLFAHDDERARVYELDPATGEVLKRIDVGSGGIPGDFEGIAVVGDRFFLVESDGTMYEFAEGEDKEDMAYEKTDTELGRRCEVEGLAFDEATSSLLLACKSTRGRDLRDHLVIFGVPLETLLPDPEPRFKIPWRSLRDVDARGRLHPSGIEVHPRSGRIFVVAAREEGIVEISRDGDFVAAAELPHSRHRQPEGIAFHEFDLLVADEASGKTATLTRYGRLTVEDGSR